VFIHVHLRLIGLFFLHVLGDLCGEHLSFVAAHHANYGWVNSTLGAIFAFIHHLSSALGVFVPWW
jgi:hypothetical protein